MAAAVFERRMDSWIPDQIFMLYCACELYQRFALDHRECGG